MKRYLYLIAMVILCGLSWFKVIHDYKTGISAFNNYMELAKSSYEKKMYDDAEKKYKGALDIHPKDGKALLGLAKTYVAKEKYDDAADVYMKLLEKDPENEEVTILLANSLESGGKYSKSYEILSKVEQTDKIEQRILELKSKYSLQYIGVSGAKSWQVNSPLSLEICICTENAKGSAYNTKGKRTAYGGVTYLGPVSEDKELYPAVQDGKWCFVDKDGKRQLVTDVNYSFLGPFYNGYAVAKRDGTFGYIDKEGHEYLFGLEAAYNFTFGTAAIKQNGVIKYINTKFEITRTTKYDGIVADDYGFTIHYNRQILKSGDKCYLCDENASKVEDIYYEYICLPMESGGLIPFKKDGVYGFLSSETGKIKISPKYEDAISSGQGLCAVKENGKWGFIDESGAQVVENLFKYATSVSESGTAIVQNEAGFALLSFYYLQ